MAEKSTQHYFRSLDVNKQLISNIDNGIIILDINLSILYFNKWLEFHTSLKEEEIIDKNITDVFTNINIKTLTRKIKTALRMGTPTFYTASTSKYLIPIKINQLNVSDFHHMRQDVSVIPFDIEQKLVALIITDQTNMTNTHNLLQTNILKVEELNKELLKERETVNERVILIKFDTTNIIYDVSQAYINLLGFSKEEIASQNIFDFERLHLNTELKTTLQTHIENKQVFKFEKTSLTSDGREFWLLNTLVPEYDQYGKHIGFILFAENITSSKLNQFHQEKLLANSRTAAMGEMISMIAHQWRQPLSVINTIIATLRIKQELNILDDTSVESSYSKIETTVTYLSETIDDFRNFFKPNKELKTVSIQTIFDKSNHLLKNEMDIQGIEYQEEIEDDLIISTYQNELIQSTINILKNSIDAFSEKPHSSQLLTIKAYFQDEYINIEIEDNAGGISQDIIKKVFDPYFSTKSKNGTGLGLYVCKTIIEEHLKGKITLTSTNETTLFLIELPQKLIIQKEENESNMPTLP